MTKARVHPDRIRKVDEEIDKVIAQNDIPFEDMAAVKVTLQKAANPGLTKTEVHDMYYPQTQTSQANKGVKINRKITKVMNKYPSLFNAFKNKAVIDMDKVSKNLQHLALNAEKESQQIAASKVLMATALSIEKMSQEKRTEELSISAPLFDGKSFAEIIAEGRERHGSKVQ